MGSKWSTVRVDEIAEKIAMGPFGSNIKVETFVDDGIPVVSGMHLHGTRLEDGGFNFVTVEHAERLKNSNVYRGDVIFTHAGNIGQVAYIPDNSQYERYVISQRQFYLRCDRTKADPAFITYFFHSPEGRHRLLANASQVGVPSISRPSSNLKEIELALPSLREQSAIVDVLGSIEDRIENLRQANATLEAIAQALFKSWFVDFDPVRAKAEGREPEGMGAATAALFPSEFEDCELGLIPKGWKEKPFGSLLDHSIGGDWGSETPSGEQTERVAIIRGTDIPDLRSQSACRVPFRYSTSKKITGRTLASGDLVVEVSGGSKDQPTGRSLYLTSALLALFDCPVVPASFCRKFSPITPQIGVLLAQHMDFIYAAGRTWEYQNQSTGIANFQTKHFLANEKVVLPSEEVLNAFCSIVGSIVERTQLSYAGPLADLRDTLLPRLISGKLRLPEAETILEDALA